MPPSPMAANYRRPKPVDPLWYRPTCTLRITCPCGRIVEHTVRDVQRRHGLPGTMRLHELIALLRCRVCGARPEGEVVRGGED